jgi:hypothetical protein
MERLMKKGMVFLAGLLMWTPSIALAQERPVEEVDLPRWVAEDVIGFFNDPTTFHFTGRTRIPSTRVVLGNVAVLGGPFTLAGEVDGDLVVVNGDLVLETGGVVSGNVLVVGGRVLGQELGEIGGNLRVFDEPLRYVQRGDRIAAAGRPPERKGFGPDFAWGDARFMIKSGQNYNRTEGLPVMFGPSIRTAGSNPFRLDLFGIWRTDMGFDLDEEDLGYALRAEQSLGGRDQFAVGGTLFSSIAPVEDWGLTNLETSLAAFILHEDFRDYYEREGWSAYARLRFPFLPVELRAEYFEEDHTFAPVRGPWSITDNNDPWREQPLVAEGKFRYVQGSLTVDARNNVSDPTDGWYIQARGRTGLGGNLVRPAHLAGLEEPLSSTPVDETVYETDFVTGFLDIRSYNRINPGASLNLRGVAGGALNDVSLPPQYQHAIGGVGSLPGFPLFHVDCGARAEVRGFDYEIDDVPVQGGVYPSYGCDRFALFQAEFRGSLFVDWGFGWDDDNDDWDEGWNWYPSVDLSPDWAAFFNMGKGWNIDGYESRTLMDLGVGIFFGDLGFYFAYPLNEDENGDRDGNFFIRLSRRF